MGEIFKRTVPAAPLPWTGERLTTGAGRQVEAEHLHRYLLARDFCRGLDVLDVSSGEGYGSAFLAQTARSVIGVEIDPDVVKHARSAYVAPNLRFLEGDARQLTLPDACMDVIVSFETIEHFYEHDAFMTEIRRVLRPGGRFVVSSPERDVYSPAGLPPNPYHVRELTRFEFSELLHGTFKYVALLGQRPLLGSALIAEDRNLAAMAFPVLTFERRGVDSFEASEGLPRPVYLLAVASDEPLEMIPDSLYIDDNTIEPGGSSAELEEARRGAQVLAEAQKYARHLEAELTRSEAELEEARRGAQVLAEAQKYARHLEAELACRERDLVDVRTALAAAKARGEAASKLKRGIVARDIALAEAVRATDRIRAEFRTVVAKAAGVSADVQNTGAAVTGKVGPVRHLETELAAKVAQLDAILGSTSWKITWPLRSLLERYPRARRNLRRVASLAWWTVTLQLPRRVADQFRRRSSVPELMTSAPASPEYPGSLQQLAGSAREGSANFHNRIQTSVELDLKTLLVEHARTELLDFLAAGDRLSFPASEAPDVSVVIVLWNKAHFTLRCLRALLAQLGPSLDVILVDNASTDETGTLLQRLDGVRVLHSKTNEGFLKGCNRGAEIARGRALLLLNSDAFPRPGALTAALGTLESATDIGMVGGRLILPSGLLQEAGSIIWSDASTLGYGRGLSPEDGQAMFRRNVDYCSGAFLLTSVALWKRIGGFDDTYAPAYYEEADFCMRLREAGYRVVYEPQAAVDHYEFGSEASLGDAICASLRNRKYFRARHSAELRRSHLPASEINVFAARERLAPRQRRLLVIDNEVPLGALGSGYPRAREMLREADAAGWSVTLFPLHQLHVDWEASRQELPWEIELVSEHAWPRFAEFMETRRGHYDVVLVSRPDNMSLVRKLLGDRPHVLNGTWLIYDAEALSAARDAAKANAEGAPLTPSDVEARIAGEVALGEQVDAIVCVNEAEAEVFRKRQSSPVYVLSHPADPIPTAGFSSRSGFLFVGRLLERDAPNWQGLKWFIRESWPLIRAMLPEATLTVVGWLHADSRELEGPGIKLLGAIADLEPLYASARVFVAPTRFAAGLPIKILEATAAGLPTVATRLMARQLAWTPGFEIAAENDAAALATAAVDLHEDEAAWDAMRVSSQARLVGEHGSGVFRRRLRCILQSHQQPKQSSAYPNDQQGGTDVDAQRIARVETVWGSAPPHGAAEQWATYPLSHPVVKAAMNRRATGDARETPYARLASQLAAWGFAIPIRKAASLCCGAGALERELVRSGLLADCIGYDLATSALDAAREAAAAEGFTGLRYERRDLERDGLGVSSLDLVLTHQGVHHLSKLEDLFDAVREALIPGGVFHLHEFVGADRFQWPDRQVNEMTAWLRSVPERYRRTRSGAIKECVGRATIAEMIAHDPSEAIRSSAIELLVTERFEVVERRKLGGTLAMMALADIAQNFDPDSPKDVNYIEELLAREEELIKTGEIGSDFVVILARKSAAK
jgi:GT2 family glycosyltransferase/SAM-dependent methyltransferase